MYRKRLAISGMLLMLAAYTAIPMPYMVVHRSDGSLERIRIADIHKITFDMSISNAERVKGVAAFKRVAAVIKTGKLSTASEYSLKKRSRVNIDIFDLRGNTVRNLKRGMEPAGSYRISWDYRRSDGTKVTAGSYIACVLVDGVPYSKCLYIVE